MSRPPSLTLSDTLGPYTTHCRSRHVTPTPGRSSVRTQEGGEVRMALVHRQRHEQRERKTRQPPLYLIVDQHHSRHQPVDEQHTDGEDIEHGFALQPEGIGGGDRHISKGGDARSEEHTSELQSLMRISYAVFCLKKNTITPSRA